MGHQDLNTETYVEAHHASIKAIKGNDPNRSVEVFITDLMKRSKLCFDNLQQAKHKWATEDAIELSKFSSMEREHLSDARKQLDNLPYHWFKDQYDHHRQYNVLDTVEGGLKGSRVFHTSQDKSNGYFIPDDGDGLYLNCPCYDCGAMQNICRHLQANASLRD